MTSSRTSKGQIGWFANMLLKTIKVALKHIHRFGLIYGFILGIIFSFFSASTALWYFVLDYPLPWKVVDASSDSFNPEKFRFTDYINDKNLSETLHIMFPPGTEKKYVDRILGEIAGAKIIKFQREDKFAESKSNQRYYYTYNHLRRRLSEILSFSPEGEFTWKVTIIFDDRSRLKRIRVI